MAAVGDVEDAGQATDYDVAGIVKFRHCERTGPGVLPCRRLWLGVGLLCGELRDAA